ncbi:hypothetical protein GQ457_16G014200 [Hibiscus cannabinus]
MFNQCITTNPSIKKTWRGKDKAIKKMHGDWDASYNELPGWISIMQKYNLSTITDLETLPYYKNDRVMPDVRQFHRLFWTLPQCISALMHLRNASLSSRSMANSYYKNLVDPIYFLHLVCKVYEMEFPAIGSEIEWHGNQTWSTILHDPKVRRNKSGRPNSTRIHNAMDMPQQ